MIPSFKEAINELAKIKGVSVYKCAQENHYGIIVDHMYQMKVWALDPSDDFILLYLILTNSLKVSEMPIG